MGPLFTPFCSLEHLHRAWRVVRRQLWQTGWHPLREQLAEFERQPIARLQRLQAELQEGTFRFQPRLAYVKRKSGGSRRGVTVPGVTDRIVQRALLAVLQSPDPRLRRHLGGLTTVLDCPTSFAGTVGRGVPEAIAAVHQALQSTARMVATSDVKDFFPHIPRSDVGEFLRREVADPRLVDLLCQGMETELANPEGVQPWLDLFPLGPAGVAQGSLLSVLAGNIALRDFDRRLNDGGVVTVRYLDDFAILGPSAQAVEAGFQRARDELSRLGMSCYAPGDASGKSVLVDGGQGFDFLGCRVHRQGISPSRRARRQLLNRLDRQLAQARQELSVWTAGETRRRAEAGHAQWMARIDQQIRGWGAAFRFVTNRASLAQLDREIDRRLAAFDAWYRQHVGSASPRQRRRLRGIALLGDTPPRSLKPPAETGGADGDERPLEED
ncbi:MAG: reverse transcriptase domain-containing protein [Planctomycetaceae bacterium]|jgi:RNA-directed DNA polymerase